MRFQTFFIRGPNVLIAVAFELITFLCKSRHQTKRLLRRQVIQQEEGMTYFDQRGQKVNNQYNIVGDVNFSTVRNTVEYIGELEKVKAALQKAAHENIIEAEVVVDANYQIDKAIQKASKPDAKRKEVIDHINEAKTLIESVSAASGLVTGLITAAEMAQKFFS